MAYETVPHIQEVNLQQLGGETLPGGGASSIPRPRLHRHRLLHVEGNSSQPTQLEEFENSAVSVPLDQVPSAVLAPEPPGVFTIPPRFSDSAYSMSPRTLFRRLWSPDLPSSQANTPSSADLSLPLPVPRARSNEEVTDSSSNLGQMPLSAPLQESNLIDDFPLPITQAPSSSSSHANNTGDVQMPVSAPVEGSSLLEAGDVLAHIACNPKQNNVSPLLGADDSSVGRGQHTPHATETPEVDIQAAANGINSPTDVLNSGGSVLDAAVVVQNGSQNEYLIDLENSLRQLREMAAGAIAEIEYHHYDLKSQETAKKSLEEYKAKLLESAQAAGQGVEFLKSENDRFLASVHVHRTLYIDRYANAQRPIDYLLNNRFITTAGIIITSVGLGVGGYLTGNMLSADPFFLKAAVYSGAVAVSAVIGALKGGYRKRREQLLDYSEPSKHLEEDQRQKIAAMDGDDSALPALADEWMDSVERHAEQVIAHQKASVASERRRSAIAMALGTAATIGVCFLGNELHSYLTSTAGHQVQATSTPSAHTSPTSQPHATPTPHVTHTPTQSPTPSPSPSPKPPGTTHSPLPQVPNHPGLDPKTAGNFWTWDWFSKLGLKPNQITPAIKHAIQLYNKAHHTNYSYREVSPNNWHIEYRGKDGSYHDMNEAQLTAFNRFVYNLSPKALLG